MKKVIKKILGIKPKESPIFKKSYSQDGEDMLLSAFYDDMGRHDEGFYVDIGALHPFRFSNTAYFYEKGWRGINIEPTPNAIELFEKHRQRDINLNIGIGEVYDELTFYCFYEPALNSFSKELSEERHNTTHFKIKETKQIPVYPLAEVLDKHLPANVKIDFMTIDAEGLDLQVLKSNNWEKYKPQFIFAEDIVSFLDLGQSKVYNFLAELGYELVGKTHRTMLFRIR